MPVYFYWGEDQFTLHQAVKQLQKRCLDPQWEAFNFEKIPGEQADATQRGLEQALTPPFGHGDRLVWVVDSTLGQSCDDALLARLQKSLPAIPADCHLLFTSGKKLDRRLKSTKYLEGNATIREFALISPWNVDALIHQIQAIARDLQLPLAAETEGFLAEALGNDTRLIWNELGKLKLYSESQPGPLTVSQVEQLVNTSTQNSLQLAQAIRDGEMAQALQLVADLLLTHNEPALKILATLTGQFRTWTLIKLALEAGEKDDKAIAAQADLSNPKRLYFLRKELRGITGGQLLKTLPLLLELEYQLKRGADPCSSLQTKVMELSSLFQPIHRRR
ncbi:DNA polymerase III subunit delta [Synechocystis sp. LEGE 06083]|uniref:DNA polymerase III subunit delta n=1 Tax=Synechocystis sp. LEGE 06083 TaxID=915336 RepID=UPI00187DE2CB|nr:DNA polymerase III subunit delta [Synechocystis sp. LEGE 06083]MBE9195362.1 DNA polymerase III subunit delta [Synechocystis sp. LEGE 06083]